jgi:Thioredoxin-like
VNGTRIAALALVLSSCLSCWSQGAAGAATHQSKPDSPVRTLSIWRKAVLAGDESALESLYSTDPPARARTPQGNFVDPGEEPKFWSALAARGLVRIDLKILYVGQPQPGVVGLALRAEISMNSGEHDRAFVVSPLEQFWVKEAGAWRILQTHRSDLAPAPRLALPEPAKPNVNLYPPPEAAPREIAAALRLAAREHKRVLLVFGANWCFDCHVLDAAFHSAKIAPLVETNFVVVKVNIGDGDKNLDLVKKYDTPADKGVPALAVLDPDGTVVMSQKNREFQSVIKLGPDDLVQFLQKWKPVRSD